MHPHLHINIPTQTQAHTYSKYQNKTGVKHVLIYTLLNFLVIY